MALAPFGAPAAFGPAFQDEMRSLLSWVQVRLDNERQRRAELEAKVKVAEDALQPELLASASSSSSSGACPSCAKHVTEMEMLIQSLTQQVQDVLDEGQSLQRDLLFAQEDLAAAQETLERKEVESQQQKKARATSFDSQAPMKKQICAPSDMEKMEFQRGTPTPQHATQGTHMAVKASADGIEKWSKLDRRMSACLANLASLPLDSKSFDLLSAEIQTLQQQRRSVLENEIIEERAPGPETATLVDHLKPGVSMIGEARNTKKQKQRQMAGNSKTRHGPLSASKLRRRIATHVAELTSRSTASEDREKLCQKIGKLMEQKRHICLSSDDGLSDVKPWYLVDSCLASVIAELAAVPVDTKLCGTLSAEVDEFRRLRRVGAAATSSRHTLSVVSAPQTASGRAGDMILEAPEIERCLATIEWQLHVAPTFSDKRSALHLMQGALKKLLRNLCASRDVELQGLTKQQRCMPNAGMSKLGQHETCAVGLASSVVLDNVSTAAGSSEFCGSGGNASLISPASDELFAYRGNQAPALQLGRGISARISTVRPVLPEQEYRRIRAESKESSGKQPEFGLGYTSVIQKIVDVSDSPLSQRVSLSEEEFLTLHMIAGVDKHKTAPQATDVDVATISQLEYRISEGIKQLAGCHPESSWYSFLSEEIEVLKQQKEQCLVALRSAKQAPERASSCLPSVPVMPERHWTDSDSEISLGGSDLSSDERGYGLNPRGESSRTSAQVVHENHQRRTCAAANTCSDQTLRNIVFASAYLDQRINLCISELASCSSECEKRRDLIQEIASLQDQQRKALQLPTTQPKVEINVESKAEAVVEVISRLEEERLRLRSELEDLQADERANGAQMSSLHSEERALKEELDQANATAERVMSAVNEAKQQMLQLQNENDRLWSKAAHK